MKTYPNTLMNLVVSVAVCAVLFCTCVYSQSEKFAKTLKKAQAGDAPSQYNLGVMYRDGEGVPKDSREAVKWFSKAAVHGDASAQTNLGVQYANGEGVENDFIKALAWFYVAKANQDDMNKENQKILAENIRNCESMLGSNDRALAEQLAAELYKRIYRK